jgi:N-acetylmuramoyl-L-alanine amidase
MSLTPDSPVATQVVPSPNHDERTLPVDALILHYTGMASAGEALLRLCNPLAKVSSHYLVFEEGRVVQMVPEARRAWHAGLSAWEGGRDLNSRSIGIEIAHPGHAGDGPPAPFPEAQMAAVTALCRDILGRWPIRPDRVLGHSDIAPERKIDPGESFSWPALHRDGIGHWVAPAPIRDGRFFSEGDAGQPIEALQSMFALYGYDVPVSGTFDARTKAVVTAFQRHFRPDRVDGVADASTITTLRDLLAGKPA